MCYGVFLIKAFEFVLLSKYHLDRIIDFTVKAYILQHYLEKSHKTHKTMNHLFLIRVVANHERLQNKTRAFFMFLIKVAIDLRHY